MSDLVNASPQAIKDLARALERYQTEMAQAGKDVRKAIDRANWHDRQKDAFEARFKDFQRGNARFLEGEVKQMVKALNELAHRLEHAKNIRM